MPAVPLKSEYGPTLGALLAPRWLAARPGRRALWVVVVGLVLGAIVGAALTLAPPRISAGGAVPFSFSYRGLRRVPPGPGWLARVQSASRGRLQDSFAVAPLTLPPYQGTPEVALALYAVGYVHRLAAARAPGQQGFVLLGEGSTQIDEVSDYSTYNVFYTTVVDGQEMYGRNVLLLAPPPRARGGLQIAMLTAAGNRQVTSPVYVGVKGTLEEPLSTFALE